MQAASLGCSNSSDSRAKPGEEILREDCKTGQALHIYQLGSEQVALTVRGLVHDTSQRQEVITEAFVDVQASDVGTRAIVLCGAGGTFVEFVREQ